MVNNAPIIGTGPFSINGVYDVGTTPSSYTHYTAFDGTLTLSTFDLPGKGANILSRGVLEELAQRNPKAKEMDPKRFFDDSFVRQMQASGFIDGMYR
jgi:hypothetical protein